jgi:hypothetical protein
MLLMRMQQLLLVLLVVRTMLLLLLGVLRMKADGRVMIRGGVTRKRRLIIRRIALTIVLGIRLAVLVRRDRLRRRRRRDERGTRLPRRRGLGRN